jgi:hypothetical protein
MVKMRSLLQALIAIAALGMALFVTPAASAASVQSNCGINVGGHPGQYICEYPPSLVQWPDGHYQWFVVGTDSAVYDTYELAPGSSTWSNWRNLGGVARSGVDVTALSSSRITIRVWGTYNGWWCKTWTASSDWGPWVDC